jgi:peptidoglycan hydrolase-like protein with peptidoglycan-binding domain
MAAAHQQKTQANTAPVHQRPQHVVQPVQDDAVFGATAPREGRTPARTGLPFSPRGVAHLQRVIGNTAMRGLLQRIPGEGTSTADAQDRALAQELLQLIQRQGGLNIALYMINAHDDPTVYENDDEFKTQARAYASQHQTFGLRSGRLSRGVEIGIDQPVTTEIEQVLTAASELLGRFPDLYTERPTVRVQVLNIFTHGTTTALAAGPHGGGHWIGAQRFASGMAQHLTSRPIINLYACSTAGTVASGGSNFATAVQEQITRDLQQRDGAQAGAQVWGHQVAGHTTYNATLVGVGAGDGLKTNLSARLAEQALAQRGITQPTEQQRTQLMEAARRVLNSTFSRGHTGSNDPRQVYFRDIPLLGMDRVWTDLSGATAPTGYGDLGMSEQGAALMVRGAAVYREAFQGQLAVFNTRANTILQATPAPGPTPPAPAPGPTPPAPAPGPTPPAPAPGPTPPAPAPAPSRPMLRLGSRGEDVRNLQIQLNTRGMATPPLTVDGVFGQATLAAVRRVQSSAGLTADGIVGPMTWNALSSAAPPAPAPTPAPGPTPPAPSTPESGRTAPGTSGTQAGVGNYVVYQDEVRAGGTLAWRNTNPGNIIAGSFARNHGAIGSNGRFAVWPTEAAGMDAIVALLRTGTYQSKTVLQAMQTYAPASDNNDPEAYANNIRRMTGIEPSRQMSSLNDDEMQAMAGAIRRVEGWRAGTSYARGNAANPPWVTALLGP